MPPPANTQAPAGPEVIKLFFQSQLKARLKSLSLNSAESEFEFKVIKLSERDLN